MYTHTLASSHTQNTCDEALFFLYFCLVYVRLGIKETGIKKKKKKGRNMVLREISKWT